MGSRIEKQYDELEGILAGVTKPRHLPLALLEDITEHFCEERKIGQGGFGTVYKGVFRNKNVAVKKILVNIDTVDERLFRHEVKILMMIDNHRNLVRFLGFCSNTARAMEEQTGSKEAVYPQIIDRLLCFEYISNGSLDKHITDEFRGLTWDKRFDIITGICEGLRYLHKDISLIHMDLKPANILLDEHMVPKITDFGLSRSTKNTHTQGERFITRGYCAPEYLIDGQMSDKADIYSLGVIIVELVTGTKNIPDDTHVLRRWIHRWNRRPTQHQQQHQHQHQQVIKCLKMAVRCREREPKRRPSITDIIRDLSGTGSSNGLIGQTSLCLYDDMLGIEPLELRFPLEHNKQTSCSVELTNDTSNSIAFNIRTPNKQYSTRPDKGVVLPGCKRDVKITLQPQESAIQVTRSDMFVVQSTQVNERLADEDITERMFTRKGSKKVVDRVNIMVLYEPEKHQVALSLDPQEEAVSKDLESSNYNNTRHSSIPPELVYYDPVESISRNQATSLTSDKTMDLATGAIGSLLPKLSKLLNQCNLETSIRGDLDCVIQDLRVMRVDLCNVSEVQWENRNEQVKLVKLWASEVRELTYDIEDVVDDFLMHAEGSEPSTNTGVLMELIQKIGHAIKDIKNQVQHKSGLKGKYKVEEVVANTVSSINFNHLSGLVKEVFGINDAMKDFTERLRGTDVKELKVHSIFGSGGLGKTTLARAVYDQLKGSFRLTAFVPVGRNPNVKKLLYDILFELDERRYLELKPAELDERQLIDVLKKLLGNNRYLIVIDDLWNKKLWHDAIKHAFVDNKHGSKLIITTRILEVATIATDLYKLYPLSPGYSKQLFYATLSPEEGRCDVKDEVIEKILSKCGGVPLAIITIASLLASKQMEDWPKVYNSIGFGHEDNGDVDKTRKLLLFSYSDLPRHLRTCLLHLSIYPEDSFICKDMAIWKWVAEGFVPEERGRGLFEVGERYFNQLVSRSMIHLVVEWDSTLRFRIHDLVLDMICSLSKEENFVTLLETEEHHTSPNKNVRRLAVQKRKIEKPYCMVQLRSFYAIDCGILVMPTLPNFKALRVLSMDKCQFSGDRLEHIGKLRQLRFLGLEGVPIDKLPDEIGDLLFLQTLILNNTRIKELPHSVGLLRQLKCLRADYCDRLGAPDWMVNMTSLEDLSLLGAYLPTVFVEGLGKLKELRDLELTIHSPSLLKSVGNLPKLQTLRLVGTIWDIGDDILEGFVPPRLLHSMSMRVRFSRFPPWMDSTHLPSLSYLELELGRMEARCLEILGRLPELHTLKLIAPMGPWLAVTGNGAFPKLRHLYSYYATLRFQRGVMSRLEYLELIVDVLELRVDFDWDFTSLGNLPLLQKVKVGLILPWMEDKWGGYVDHDLGKDEKRMMLAAVKHAVNTHPHRRPVLHVADI